MIRSAVLCLPIGAAAWLCGAVAVYVTGVLIVLFAHGMDLDYGRVDALRASQLATAVILTSATAALAGSALWLARLLRVDRYLALGVAGLAAGISLDTLLAMVSGLNAVIFCESYPFDWVDTVPCR
jgi:hypothetical protein